MAGGGGLLWFLLKLKNRKPETVERDDKGLHYELVVDEGGYKETISASTDVVRLYQNGFVRRSIHDVVSPVRDPGVDSLSFQHRGQRVHKVTKETLEYFWAPEYQDLILDEVGRRAFSIERLSFKQNNKWRLNDGTQTLSVTMKDETFQKKVDNNEISFAKGDTLMCELRTMQWHSTDGIKSSYEVLKVLKHIPARQLPLLDEPFA